MSLYKDGRLLATEIGEVHFRKNALSGVITFIISSHLVWAYKIDSKAKHDIRINFLSSMSEKEIKEVLKLDNPIRSLFSERIAHYLEGRMKKDKISLSNTLTNLSFTPIIKNGALFNHVTNGGVKLELIDLDTLSSTKDSHLFVVGEVLDIDGLCGGYNLMFAIYSGIVAARHILTEVVN
jgi:predicted flavoprotein YhiN